jgi:hypothetical protein
MTLKHAANYIKVANGNYPTTTLMSVTNNTMTIIMTKIIFVRVFITLILFTIAMGATAAKLTTSVDRTAITINDTLLLTITLDQQGADEIDFSTLELQFDILQRQRSSQTSIVNWQKTSLTQWTLVIAPKETGNLLIPSLSANGAFSDAIKVSVVDNSAANPNNAQGSSQGSVQKNSPNNSQTNNTDEVFLRAAIDKDNVYVQEQLILRLQLHYRISLSDYKAGEFAIDNSAQELIDKKNYKTTLNGVSYNVLEHVYALHPQTSGTFTIPQQLWQVEKPSKRFGRIQSPFIRVTSQPITINVKPIPDESTPDHWLPASNINFIQEWQQSTISAKVGEPLSYQLTITAEGLGHSQLPNISLDASANEDFTIYSDKADTKNQLSTKGIIGTRVINYAVIPKNTGTFTLPPISLRWWNINTDREEVITLKPQRIVVASTQLDQQNTIPTITRDTIETSRSSATASPITLRLWQLSTAVFFILWVLFFYLWLTKRNNSSDANTYSTRGSFNNASHENKKRSLKVVYNDIEHAVEKKQYPTIKVLLLEWASHKTEKKVNNSDELIGYFTELAVVVKAVDKQLYSPHAINVCDFSQLVSMLQKQEYNQQVNKNTVTLQPLHPT